MLEVYRVSINYIHEFQCSENSAADLKAAFFDPVSLFYYISAEK